MFRDKRFRMQRLDTHPADYGSAWTLKSQFMKGYIGLCYKNYNQNVTLPEWDIEQERY